MTKPREDSWGTILALAEPLTICRCRTRDALLPVVRPVASLKPGSLGMPEIKLRIDDLVLDHDNPRISHAAGQQEALQKIVHDQRTKLVKLAQSIVEYGLNPMDRFLVLQRNQTPKKYISLEGNRRVAVFILLTKPVVMTGLEMPPPMKRIFERLATDFKKSRIEPLACFELSSREEGRYWLNLRHNIGHEGAGVDNWKSLAKRRFEGKPPAVQALELITERAGLTKTEQASITDKFPTSTLERILENRQARLELGFDIKDGKLITKLPAAEIVKPLKKIILDLATKRTQVGKLMKTDDMLRYVRDDLGKANLPDLSKAQAEARGLDEIPTSEFSKIRPSVVRRKPDPSDRREIVPKGCPINVKDNRIAEIYKELRTLKLEEGPSPAPNAIAVLLRVFLELSVDHFLDSNDIKLTKPKPGGGEYFRSLDDKVQEAIDILVKKGVPADKLAAVIRSLSDKASPLHSETLHAYIHNRFDTPSPAQLKAAWDRAQPLFERIWPDV